MIGDILKVVAENAWKVWDRWTGGSVDRQRKARLKEMLSDERFEFRKLSTLMEAVAADEATTKRLLIEIGARPSEPPNPRNLWTLNPPPGGT